MVRKETLYDFNPIKFVKIVLWPNTWSLLENVSFILAKNILLLLGGVFCTNLTAIGVKSNDSLLIFGLVVYIESVA